MARRPTGMIGIIDYGLGNLFSLEKALKRAGLPYLVSAEIKTLQECDRFILSGVGHFKYGMDELHKRSLISFLKEDVAGRSKPLFGICLGMQLLRDFSEEGHVAGLGLVSGKVTKLDVSAPLKIPHIGWNTISAKGNPKLLQGIDPDSRFYFTHSYGSRETNNSAVAGTTDYGGAFVSIIEQGTIFGMQCHPEKSFGQGLQVLKNFAAL